MKQNLKPLRLAAPIMAPVTLLFILAELTLWVLVQVNIRGYNNYIDYSSVALAAAFGLASASLNPRGEWLLRVGLLFTLLADWFMVVASPTEDFVGVCVFNFAQLSYFIYLLSLDKAGKDRLIHVAFRACLVTVGVLTCFLVLGADADPLSIVSIIYFSNLVLNALWSLRHRRYLLFAGLLMFILCDVTVGLQALIFNYGLVERGSVIWQIIMSDFDFIWFFYVPSQALIALSALGDVGWKILGKIFAQIFKFREKA